MDASGPANECMCYDHDRMLCIGTVIIEGILCEKGNIIVIVHIELARVPPSQRKGHAAALGPEHLEHRLLLVNLSDQLRRGYTILKHKEEDRLLTDENGMGL
jgi:hypothetical protein